MKRWVMAVIALSLAAALAGCSRHPSRGQVRSEGAPTGDAVARPTGVAAIPTSKGVGLPNLGAPAAVEPLPQTYTVQGGDTLTSIAERYGLSIEALVRTNHISDPNSLQVGQVLKLSLAVTDSGPSTELLPDSEFVNGPGYVGFDLRAFCSQRGGYLASYSEVVDGQRLSGPEIVELIVHEYSVGPRMLLAVLESESGWVTDAHPAQVSWAMGYQQGGYESLRQQLSWAANELNRGYYDWRARGMQAISWSDGTATAYDPGLNAATAGLQRFYSLGATKEQWQERIGTGPGSFAYAYRQLFGEPALGASEPVVTLDTPLPSLALPWPDDQMWYYTGGPHGAWGEGSAWSAVDFVPDEGYLGCAVASSWATAAASGLILYSQNGQVLIDLDGDGHEQTGWVLLYLHMAAAGRVPEGTRVRQGDRIGHPSCEGGIGNATHLHFARKFNGEWIAADGPLPLILSGWRFHSSGRSYEGTATRDGQERASCECMEADHNGLTSGR